MFSTFACWLLTGEHIQLIQWLETIWKLAQLVNGLIFAVDFVLEFYIFGPFVLHAFYKIEVNQINNYLSNI